MSGLYTETSTLYKKTPALMSGPAYVVFSTIVNVKSNNSFAYKAF